MEIVLPAPCVVVLVGMSGSGKSTWAAAHFLPVQVVSSDALRAVVGTGEDDITASDDAFALLDRIVAARVRRRLTTVVDTLGLDPIRRAEWVTLARAHTMPAICVVFACPVGEAAARNRIRAKSIPARVLSGQARQFKEQRALLSAEGFAQVIEPEVVRTAPAHVARAVATSVNAPASAPLEFGLQLPTFDWRSDTLAPTLRDIAHAAEASGFTSLWVMDHFRQIPMFGPAWKNMLDAYTTLAYLAAVTQRVTLGALVTGITHRPVPQLGKIIATLDVLSGGRARGGLGAGWYAAENTALGLPFPSLSDRYALLEDALQFLPHFWGKGAPAFHGSVLDVPEALCYPRPLQSEIPILVGGNGERRTLRLAARYASACNVIGEVEVVRRKAAILREHCRDVGRRPDDVAVTQLSTTLVADDAEALAAECERLRPRRISVDRYAASVNAGTVNDQIARYRELASAGVSQAIVSLPSLDVETVTRFSPIVESAGDAKRM